MDSLWIEILGITLTVLKVLLTASIIVVGVVDAFRYRNKRIDESRGRRGGRPEDEEKKD